MALGPLDPQVGPVTARQGMYSAKILADSIADEVRLTSMEVTFPRFILAEFNTHRVFSRNSASSRAIPVEKRIAQVWRAPFVPEAFGMNKRGMQASANLGGWKATIARWTWLLASRLCVILAWLMSKLGVHKQHANRLIELWAWHTVVVSATEWANFFALRCHPAAQPEMQITARLMREAYESSAPRKLYSGMWHLPYVTDDEWAALQRLYFDSRGDLAAWDEARAQLVRASVVRCAAVSFERQYADRTSEQITKRHDEMTSMAHWSPFEHQAQVDRTASSLLRRDDFIGNFRVPWRQYRKMFDGESVFNGG